MTASSESSRANDDSGDVLTEHLEAFLLAWETNGYGPCLSDHLPDNDHPDRRLVLIELIKVDLEYRYHSEGPVLQLEDYLDEHPELGRPDGMPVELIHEEFHLRSKHNGDSVDVNDWLQRFPEQADLIRRRLFLDEPDTPTLSGKQLSELHQPGDHIGDFYLMSTLGTGAFGCVFLARQESMQRLVALKVSSDRGTEAQTLAQLDHPNIVRVYDQIRVPEQDLRLLYMQFAAGGTLQSVVKSSRTADVKDGQVVAQCISEALQRTGVLSSEHVSLKNDMADKPWADVTCRMGKELALALHYAHDQGILHRDVKPANVLLEADGTARLADFNISFNADVESEDAATSFGGSLAYMSPEQLEACDPNHVTAPHDLDGRSDLFSLGILLWELMYGTRPFADEDVAAGWSETLSGMRQLRRQGVSQPPRAPASATEEMLLSILRRCLEPDPDDRYQSARELAQDLDLCRQPRIAQLIQESQTSWRSVALAWPMLAFLFAAVAPHIVAAAFNFYYNEQQIINNLNDEATKGRFEHLVIIINGVAFSVAFAFCIGYAKPVVNAVRARRSEATSSQLDARLRSLRLSRFVTILGITEWMIAGMAYPLALRFSVSSGGLDAIDSVHFFGSLLICGLLAAAYPFYLTATLTIRAFVPALLRHDRLTQADAKRLNQLSDQSAWSLYLAGGVPTVAMLILQTAQQDEDPIGELTLQLLSVLGAFGFAYVLSLSKRLQQDTQALLNACRTSEMRRSDR